ncbi:MAG: hypothetical protein JWO68_3456 [Actinomycetia bacterium]|nr:hypothetical protein [Actinomycetes bacterium]
MLKHVIVERPRPERAEEFVVLAQRLWDLMAERGWTTYDAWPMVAADEGEPGLFDLGILGRALPPTALTFVFEATFPDRESLEAQLRAMRTDIDAVKIILAAADLVDRTGSRAYVLEHWTSFRLDGAAAEV